MATIVNNRSTLATDPVRNFRFLVNFIFHDSTTPTTVSLGFTSVSGMAVTTDSIPYREGGYNTTVHQIPGQTTFAPVTLQRGVILGSRQNWDYMKRMFATVQAGGSALSLGKTFRCDLDIQVLNHPVPSAGANVINGGTTTANPTAATDATDQVAMRFRVYNAWPTSVAYSDLNAGDNALFVEQMTLVHEGFDLNWGTFDTTNAFVNAPSFD
jgi:phage tail-like protein